MTDGAVYEHPAIRAGTDALIEWWRVVRPTAPASYDDEVVYAHPRFRVITDWMVARAKGMRRTLERMLHIL